MKISLPLFLFIPNFILVLELLTISQIISLLTLVTSKKIINFALNNLTIWFWSLQSPLLLLLQPQILALRTMLLHLYHICTSTIDLSQRLFIMQFMLQALKQNFLLSGTVLTKPQILIAFLKLLSSLTLFMQPEKSLIHPYIPIKFSQQPFFPIFKNFSYITRITPLSFGNVLAVSIGIFTKQLIKKLRSSIYLHFFLAKLHGTLARKEKVTTL